MKTHLRNRTIWRSAGGLLVSAGVMTTAMQTASGQESARAPRNLSSVIRIAAPAASEAPADPVAGDSEADLTEAELVTERYTEGGVKTQRWVTLDPEGNFINHGSFKAYDKNGKLMGTGEYRQGKEQGKWTRYFATAEGTFLAQALDAGFESPLVSEAPLVDGKLHGAWTVRDRSGRVIIQWQFENGVRNGVSTWYYSSGEKRSEVSYKQGQMHGKFLAWGPDHKESVKAVYADGRRLTSKTEWHARGQKLSEGSYLSAPEEFEADYDWWNCTIKTTAARQEGPGAKHGAWTYWYPNGKMKMQGEYKEDMPVGKFTWWFENGQKQAEGEYLEGRQNGNWIGWHPNGMKKYRGQYSSGTQSGQWMVWKPDGRRAEVHDYGQIAESEGTTEEGLADENVPSEVIATDDAATQPRPQAAESEADVAREPVPLFR